MEVEVLISIHVISFYDQLHPYITKFWNVSSHEYNLIHHSSEVTLKISRLWYSWLI
jgi:hypothetical protein